MNNVNTIVFSKDRYDNDRNKMFQAIAQMLALLMDNEYTCKVYDDDRDIIVIQFEHDNQKDYWGTPDLCWLEEDEVDVVESYRLSKKNDTE